MDGREPLDFAPCSFGAYAKSRKPQYVQCGVADVFDFRNGQHPPFLGIDLCGGKGKNASGALASTPHTRLATANIFLKTVWLQFPRIIPV
jgi:hypothetical protein